MADALLTRVGAPGSVDFGAPVVTNFGLSLATSALEYIFMAPEAALIAELGFRFGLRTGTPPVYEISLQGVDLSTGFPDGVIKGGGSPASGTFQPPASTGWNSAIQWVSLANAYNCGSGELLALVIKHSSGLIDVSNYGSFASYNSALPTTANRFPFVIQNNNGSRSRIANGPPVFGYRSASRTYGLLHLGTASTTFSSPSVQGLKFSLPAGWGSTFKVAGVRMFHRIASVTALTKIYLYDSDSLQLQPEIDVDSDAIASTVSTGGVGEYYFPGPLATLKFGDVYRVGIVADATTNFVTYYSLDAAGSADIFQCGEQFMFSTRTGTGAWTDDALKRPLIELILADVTGYPGPTNFYNRSKRDLLSGALNLES